MPTVSLILSIYGAVLATVAFGWNVSRTIREMARIRLRVTLSELVPLGVDMGATSKETVVGVEVVNLGRETIQIASFGGEADRTKTTTPRDFVIVQTSPTRYPLPLFPWVLAAGDRKNFVLPVEAFPPDCACYFVSDTTGRKWRTNAKDFRRLKKEVEDFRAGTKTA